MARIFETFSARRNASVKYRSSIGRMSAVSVKYRSSVCQVSAKYRRSVGQVSAKCRRGIGDLKSYVGRHTCRSTVGRQSIATRSILIDNRSPVDRQSTECRSSSDRVSVDITYSKHDHRTIKGHYKSKLVTLTEQHAPWPPNKLSRLTSKCKYSQLHNNPCNSAKIQPRTLRTL